MKPQYDSWLGKWMVSGIGYFETKAEAQKVIDKNRLNAHLSIYVTEQEKEYLERLASSQGICTAKLIRAMIRKEMQNG